MTPELKGSVVAFCPFTEALVVLALLGSSGPYCFRGLCPLCPSDILGDGQIVEFHVRASEYRTDGVAFGVVTRPAVDD